MIEDRSCRIVFAPTSEFLAFPMAEMKVETKRNMKDNLKDVAARGDRIAAEGLVAAKLDLTPS